MAVLVTWSALATSTHPTVCIREIQPPAVIEIISEDIGRSLRRVQESEQERHHCCIGSSTLVTASAETTTTASATTPDFQNRTLSCPDPTMSTPAIAHLTSQELYAFLFGDIRTDKSCHAAPCVSGPVSTAHAFYGTGDNGGASCFGGCGNCGIPSSQCSVPAGRTAAGGGGFCLLQRYICPAGERNSTLRCHWTSASTEYVSNSQSATTGTNISTNNTALKKAKHEFHSRFGRTVVGSTDRAWVGRWGEAKEVEMGLRERSPNRSPHRTHYQERPLFSERPPERLSPERGEKGTGPVTSRRTAGLELGSAGTVLTGDVFRGCVLERCSNQFRAARSDVSCEDR